MFSLNEIIKATQGKLVRQGRVKKVSGICTDSRKIKSGEVFLALKGKNFDGHNFIDQSIKQGAGILIVEKLKRNVAADAAVVLVKNTTLALGALAGYQREKFGLPVIAVTGSNGKTTTKEMIACVLGVKGKILKNEGTQNNQIGLPQTLVKLSPEDKFAVVEIGTNHFGEIKYLAEIAKPNIGLITNIGSSHLEFLKSLKGVLGEKLSLFQALEMPGIAVINADDKLLQRAACKRKRVLTFGVKEKSDFSAKDIRLERGLLKFKTGGKFDFSLPTLGYHNVYNALAAISVGRIFGLTYPQIRQRLSGFIFPKGRLNLIKFRGVNFIDDTYNSNPLSLEAALTAMRRAGFKGKKILLMGDMLELGVKKEMLHRQIGRSITNVCDFLLTVGKLSRITASEAARAGLRNNKIFCFADILEARKFLFGRLALGKEDLVLVKGSRSMRMEEVFNI